MSPIIEVIIGLMPADTDNEIAMTGIIARHGIEPGPEALSVIPMKNITAGIARARYEIDDLLCGKLQRTVRADDGK